jgi:hypothetical protein
METPKVQRRSPFYPENRSRSEGMAFESMTGSHRETFVYINDIIEASTEALRQR